MWHGWDKGTLTWIFGELCTHKVCSPAIDENEYKWYVTSSKAAGNGILALYIVYNSAIACLVILALVCQNYIYGVYLESEWILIWWSSLKLARYCVSLRHCRNCSMTYKYQGKLLCRSISASVLGESSMVSQCLAALPSQLDVCRPSVEVVAWWLLLNMNMRIWTEVADSWGFFRVLQRKGGIDRIPGRSKKTPLWPFLR